MAGLLARVNSGELSVPGTTNPVTMLQIKSAANHRVKIIGVSVSFKGTVSNEPPLLVQVLRQSDAGTDGVPITCYKNNESDQETIQTYAQKGTFYIEPSEGNILYSIDVHPQGGWQIMFPYGQEIILPGSTATTYYLGIRVISSTSNSAISCIAQLDFEE
jgi:hypothetical protein